MHRIRDKDLRKLIRPDICKLQLAQTQAEIETASQLYIKKWIFDDRTLDFAEYFTTNHIQKANGWYGHIGNLFCNVRQEAKDILIGEKRKNGRAKLARKALLRQ